MELMEAIEKRHAVRKYIDKAIEPGVKAELEAEIDECNKLGGLHMQLVTDEPGAFGSALVHYGMFKGVKNYIAMAGKKGPELDEKIGYYGERIVLKAQQLGLNSCWVALNFSKRKSRYVLDRGEKLVCVVAIGYGQTQGIPHKSKPLERFYEADGEIPEWFMNGITAASLAPTAVNQQRFKFILKGNEVDARATGGFYSKLALGIVKYHFEVGAGTDNFIWK